MDALGNQVRSGPGAPTGLRLRRYRAEDRLVGPRVVVADDSQLQRALIGTLVTAEEGLQVAGEADSAWTALGVVGAEQPVGPAGHPPARELLHVDRVIRKSAHPDQLTAALRSMSLQGVTGPVT